MKDLNVYIIEGLLDNKLLRPLRDFIHKNFKKRVGFKEEIKICINKDVYTFTATLDTGNGGVVPTLGVDKMSIDGDKVIVTIGEKEYTFNKKGEASPTVGNVVHHRPIVIINYIEIGGRRLNEPFIAVTDERKKSTKTLINRDTMSKLNLVIDPSKNSLIHEKLTINKDTEVNINIDEINNEVISKLKEYYFDKWGIKFEDYRATIRVGFSNEYIIITLKNYHDSYKGMMKYIDNNFDLAKPCSTNNQSIYVYPKYE